MRFQLLGLWPIGQYTIPADTVIEVIDGKANWNGVELRPPLPMNAKALDQSAYIAMCEWYPGLENELIFDREVVTPKRTG